MKRYILIFLIVLFSSSISAQTAWTAHWDYAGILLTEVNTYTQVVELDGTAITNSINCATKGTGVHCTVLIGTLSNAAHSLRVAATKSGITAEAILNNINPVNGPKVQTSVTITSTITVTIP